jgi:hypothetical protein
VRCRLGRYFWYLAVTFFGSVKLYSRSRQIGH